MTTLSEWIGARVETPPSGFVQRLASERSVDGSVCEVLVEEARARLQSALKEPNESREAAFGLLAADAYATYACEAAADSADVEEALRRILSQVANGIA